MPYIWRSRVCFLKGLNGKKCDYLIVFIYYLLLIHCSNGYYFIALYSSWVISESPWSILSRSTKPRIAILTGVFGWTAYILLAGDHHQVTHELTEHLGDVSSILFFLLGAMTIVELIDAHDGFQIINHRIKTKDKRTLLWIVSFVAFFLSAVLDNLTTTIVIVSLLRKLIDNREDRLFFVGLTIVAANAGGAWTPIGDVTTTMLWIGNQITTGSLMLKVLLPSLVCLLIPLLVISMYIKGEVKVG